MESVKQVIIKCCLYILNLLDKTVPGLQTLVSKFLWLHSMFTLEHNSYFHWILTHGLLLNYFSTFE